MPSELSEQKIKAALLVAQGHLSNQQIAQRLEMGERTLDGWKKEPEFKRLVSDHLNAWLVEIHHKGIADRRRRIFQLNLRWRKAQAIAEARAKDPAIRRLPGGATGFIVRRLRSIRRGDGQFAVIEEGQFDSALFRDLLAIEQQAARELGQWDAAEQRTIRRLSDLSREEIEALILDLSKAHGIPGPDLSHAGNPTVAD